MDGAVGLVLGAGDGTRFDRSEALARRPDGTAWTTRAVRLLRSAGCERVVVVLGAEADTAHGPVDGAEVVVARDAKPGLGASLAVGLGALPAADAVLVMPADLPGLPRSVVERVLEGGTARDRLARAVYAGLPGHPVLVGWDHWAALADALHDDDGRAYLEEHGVDRVECGDLFDGGAVDRPARPA